MIKIVRGKEELIVSNETYKTMFKDLGYVIADEGVVKSASSKAKEDTKKDTKNIDEVKELDNSKAKEDNLSKEEKNDLKINSEKKEDIDNILDILSEDNKKNKKK